MRREEIITPNIVYVFNHQNTIYAGKYVGKDDTYIKFENVVRSIGTHPGMSVSHTVEPEMIFPHQNMGGMKRIDFQPVLRQRYETLIAKLGNE